MIGQLQATALQQWLEDKARGAPLGQFRQFLPTGGPSPQFIQQIGTFHRSLLEFARFVEVLQFKSDIGQPVVERATQRFPDTRVGLAARA